MTDPLTNLRAKVAAATPGEWAIENDGSLVNRDLDDPQYDHNDDGKPAWDIGEIYAPINAALIAFAVNLTKRLVTEEAVRAMSEAYERSRWQTMQADGGHKSLTDYHDHMRAAINALIGGAG